MHGRLPSGFAAAGKSWWLKGRPGACQAHFMVGKSGKILVEKRDMRMQASGFLSQLGV